MFLIVIPKCGIGNEFFLSTAGGAMISRRQATKSDILVYITGIMQNEN